jgi:hypothetical protein
MVAAGADGLDQAGVHFAGSQASPSLATSSRSEIRPEISWIAV